jgi:putative methyltransferase (TIGR04325 family)
VRPLAIRIRGFLLRALRASPSAAPHAEKFNWEGVFQRFADVPSQGAGFENDAWVEDTRRLTERALQEYGGRTGLPEISEENAFLPLLLATAFGSRTSKVKILDFGGGMGVSYIHAIGALQHPERIEYHIVEKPQVCKQGRQLFARDAHVHFHEELPESLAGLDIVYINSALQYVEDYGLLLRQLCALSPHFFFLARCSAGDVPTYATAQVTLPGQRLPYWFINTGELGAIFASCGYRPVFTARGSYKLDQSNFEERYRIGSACNLLFSKAPGQ